MDRWQGRVAVVTGASEGIGEAVVRRLAASGMKVVALARRQHLLEALEKDINSKTKPPGCCKGRVCDVSDEAQVKSTFDWIKANVGPVSVLVNNAAMFKYISLPDMDMDIFRTTLNTNVTGLMCCTQQGLASMKGAGIEDGHIININSVCGHEDLRIPGISVYTAGKHALTLLTRSLRRELAEIKSKIKITSVSPGLVNTTMSEWYTKDNPQTPALTAEEVVDAVMYALTSPKSVNEAQYGSPASMERREQKSHLFED